MSAGLRYRLGVASRAVAAIAGGYGVAALSAAALALCLPAAFGMARSEAAMTGTLASFLVFAIAVMWVFAARSAWRAWIGLVIAAAPLDVRATPNLLTRFKLMRLRDNPELCCSPACRLVVFCRVISIR